MPPNAYPLPHQQHQAVASWFLGPRAENIDFLKKYVQSILEDVQKTRRNLHPQDGVTTSELG